MIAVLYGALGALSVLALLSLGAAIGWKARSLQEMRRGVAEESDEEKRRFMEEQSAFENMLHYNIDTAYGRDRDLEELLGGEEL